MLHLRLVLLFMVKNLVIPFNPNNPKRNASKKMSYFDHLTKLLRDPLTKHCLFPNEIIIILSPHPAKLVHDTSSSSPRPPSLDTIPKLMLNGFDSVRETKHALLRKGCLCDAGPPLINGNRFVSN